MACQIAKVTLPTAKQGFIEYMNLKQAIIIFALYGGANLWSKERIKEN